MNVNPNSPYVHKLFSSRVKIDPHGFVGDAGRLFFNEVTGEIRISDGVTPYGWPVFATNGTGGVSLERYTENGSPIRTPIANIPGTIALGDGSDTRLFGGLTQASGVFSTSGDAQVGSYVMRGITTGNSYAELFLDGISKKFLIYPNTSIAYTATIIARRVDSNSNEGAVYEIRGGVDRSVTLISTRLIGTPSKTVVSEDNPDWDARVIADVVNGALQVQVQGEHGKTIRWVCHLQTVEVGI